jgi:hypothetical protein
MRLCKYARKTEKRYCEKADLLLGHVRRDESIDIRKELMFLQCS